MTPQTLDPQDFSERLDRAFGSEPPHPSLGEDIRLGKRRLLRRRASVALGGLAVAAVVSGAASLVPTVVTGLDGVAPATGGPMTDEETVATCMRKENVLHVTEGRYLNDGPALVLMGEEPRLMTSAAIANRTEATLLSEDGKYWGECQFQNAPDNGVKNSMNVFSTDISFPSVQVDGVRAYEPVNEADAGLEGTATPPLPQFELTCPSGYDGDDNFEAEARCREFTMHWNDRRPAEVAAVRVTTPDGVSSWAQVKRGFLSFAYTGRVTPEIAEQVARGENPGAQRVVFYDKDGNVLVDDRDPGHLPGDGELSILSFPSLAWWLR